MRNLSLVSSFAVATLGLLAGCSDRSLPGQSPAYLSSDKCIQSTDATTCAAQTGCQWVGVTPPIAPGSNISPAQTFVCVAQDPCLTLDQTHCLADTGCAWSAVATLCPVGSDCSAGGFCHARDDSGGSCACLSPIACPKDAPCPKVECDCSGGGSGGGGGACACACPDCPAGQSCTPCACNCGSGGGDGGGGGCGDVGTCVCACPACLAGESCPPCDCNCGDGGGSTVTKDPCSQFTDADSCEHNGTFSCGVAPGPGGLFTCVSTNSSSPDPTPPCVCNCPTCAPDSNCMPCDCACEGMGGVDGGSVDGGSSGGGSGCIPPPPPPSPPTMGGPVACPALGCGTRCQNGNKIVDGCPTCDCL